MKISKVDLISKILYSIFRNAIKWSINTNKLLSNLSEISDFNRLNLLYFGFEKATSVHQHHCNWIKVNESASTSALTSKRVAISVFNAYINTHKNDAQKTKVWFFWKRIIQKCSLSDIDQTKTICLRFLLINT